jgi:XTP/dITP diphosphohydrolase
MAQILLASNNPGKLVEIQSILASTELTLVLPRQLGLHLEVEENGSSYAENAALKAAAFCKAAGMITLADDSGLEVDALNGQPGIWSARFTGRPGASDADRRAFLLQRLLPFPRPWRAHFHCTVAIAVPRGEIFFAEGDCPGEVIPRERGNNGFGYDPIFQLDDTGLTMAELSMEAKNRLSHRARAVLAAMPILTELLGGQP